MSIVLEPGDGQKLAVLGLQFTANVNATDSGGAFALNEVVVVPEAASPGPHPRHRRGVNLRTGRGTQHQGGGPHGQCQVYRE